MKVELYAPKEFWSLTPEEKAKLCNGCGTKGLGGWIVPDTLYFLSMTECCNIHDFQYREGTTIEDKEAADRTFLNNMLRVIDSQSWFIMKGLRRYRAMSYYSAVHDFGGPAFWSGKNPDNTIKVVSNG